MKRMKQIGIYMAGFITAAVIFLGSGTTWADTVLQAIYVDNSPIKIFLDGQEKEPSSDMQPFIYNGRTYVALRYIGEAFGKQVDWNGDTRTITIADPVLPSTEFDDSFTNL